MCDSVVLRPTEWRIFHPSERLYISYEVKLTSLDPKRWRIVYLDTPQSQRLRIVSSFYLFSSTVLVLVISIVRNYMRRIIGVFPKKYTSAFTTRRVRKLVRVESKVL